MDWAWGMRGWLDKAVGGVGLRRGRRHPDEIRAGESLDFWRVGEVEKNRLLRLRAEMKLPGKAWLQFESAAAGTGKHCSPSLLILRRMDCSVFFTGTRCGPSINLFLMGCTTAGWLARARVLAHSYG